MLAGRSALALVLLLAGAACKPASTPEPPPSDTAPATAPAVDPLQMLATIETLASDGLGGRYSTHPDIDRAAQVVADKLREVGATPVGEAYRHPFPISVGTQLLAPPELVLGKTAVDVAAFRPLPGSASGTVSGELVFVGYAASAQSPAAYDDLAGIDVKDKIAVVLLDAPRRPDARSLYERLRTIDHSYEEKAAPLRASGDNEALQKLQALTRTELAAVVEPFLAQPVPDTLLTVPDDPAAPLEVDAFATLVFTPSGEGTQFALSAGRLRDKLARLQKAGAAAVITVRGPRSFVDETARDEDALPDLEGTSRFRPLEIPVVQMKWTVADRLLSVGKRKLSSLQGQIERELKPQSKALGKTASLDVQLQPKHVQAPNVLGQIVGASKPDEFLIIGAHYDHIGVDEDGHGHCRATVTADAKDDICNGADDNASGTAVVLELARLLAAGPPPERTVVFALFAGEELGLLGSRALADEPPNAEPWASGKPVAMINIDMVGRLRPDPGLMIGGVGSSDAWMPMFDAAGLGDIPILFDRSVTTRSDHASFYKHEIPVVFLFTGVHDDYHAPGDETAMINAEGLGQIAELTYGVARQIAQGDPIAYTEPKALIEGLVRSLPGDNPETVERRVVPPAASQD